MRRADRAVTDGAEILRILGECDVLRLGLCDGAEAYIVPVNFGFCAAAHALTLYIHGAKKGRKYELLVKNPLCSFEADTCGGIVTNAETGLVTARYASVMGRARASFLEGEQKRAAMERFLLGRYEETRGFPYRARSLDAAFVAALQVISLTAKENAP